MMDYALFCHQDFSKNGEDVLTYLHGLPDESWPESDDQYPLSVIDQVCFDTENFFLFPISG